MFSAFGGSLDLLWMLDVGVWNLVRDDESEYSLDATQNSE
jgi:hypothetical protein